MNALSVSGYFDGTDAVGGRVLLNIIWSNCPRLYEEKGPDKEIGMKILKR
jgi:hypothetical protein